MKILFLVPYPTEGASNRIRVEQFIPYLRSRGIECAVRPFINRRFYNILYLRRKVFQKAFWFAVCTLNRLLDLVRALRYDLIFIHREAYPLGGSFLEGVLSMTGKPVVFDFDDAIFLYNTSEYNIWIERLKNPDKVKDIIKMSRHTIAGNEYLKEYALKYNDNVTVIPSSIDTDRYAPREGPRPKDHICIGWTGSNTTKRFLYDIEDVFVKLSERFKDIKFKIIGAPFYSSRLDNIVNVEWSLGREIEEMRDFDIGIMPLPDNEWTKGKCGFKALLCMSLGIPVVASRVGMNEEIIEDGVNGFLAADNREWLEKMSLLIEDKERRSRMGREGRRTVLERYSMKLAAPMLYGVLMDAHDRKK